MTEDTPALLKALYERGLDELRLGTGGDPFAARDDLARRVEHMHPAVRELWEEIAAKVTDLEIHRAEIVMDVHDPGRNRHLQGLEGTLRGLRQALSIMAGIPRASVQRFGPAGLLMLDRWDRAGWPGWPPVTQAVMEMGEPGRG